MSRSSRFAAPLALAAAALLAPARPLAAGDKILIGATLPLTGAEARVGGFFKEGYDLAFEEVSKKGGLEVGGKKLPVQLILQDEHLVEPTRQRIRDERINAEWALRRTVEEIKAIFDSIEEGYFRERRSDAVDLLDSLALLYGRSLGRREVWAALRRTRHGSR